MLRGGKWLPLSQSWRQRRVLLIVDSLSELNEFTGQSVRPAQPDFPAAALIITSRIDEYLGGASEAILRPFRLQSDRLSEFMDGYLRQWGKRSLFNDPAYFTACGRLSEIVRDREITVLIAKLCAEQMIAVKEVTAAALTASRAFPRNLPDLMLGYINYLNNQVKADKQDISQVIRVANPLSNKFLKS